MISVKSSSSTYSTWCTTDVVQYLYENEIQYLSLLLSLLVCESFCSVIKMAIAGTVEDIRWVSCRGGPSGSGSEDEAGLTFKEAALTG